MPKVKLAAVREGMVVTADVKNMDNMLLIPEGCVLTEKHIDILSAWGIPEVEVDSASSAEAPGDILQQIAPELLEEVRKELAEAFWEPLDKGPVQSEVFDLVLRRKVRQTLAKKGCAPGP